jgi:alkylhydroperoxidase family enzyme
MILPSAVVMRSEYEWHQHVALATDAGVPCEQIAAIAAWQSSQLFDAGGRAALKLTDAMLTGNVRRPSTRRWPSRSVKLQL